jgi:glucose-1-phosphate thymidylyltransferase
MKGVIICGGKGERLSPITNYINKHLLLVYNKPMFFYPLSILSFVGCREIFIVGNKKDFIFFKKILLSTTKKKIKFKYIKQEKPDGIASAFSLVERYMRQEEKFIFILGDNFFYGNNLIHIIKKNYQMNDNTIFISKAMDSWNYGTIKKINSSIQFNEKNNQSINDEVITGLYILNKSSINKIKKIKKSKRGEYEIIDLIKLIYREKKLSIVNFGRGIVWYDMGSFKNINKVSNIVQTLEDRLGQEIGNIF